MYSDSFHPFKLLSAIFRASMHAQMVDLFFSPDSWVIPVCSKSKLKLNRVLQKKTPRLRTQKFADPMKRRDVSPQKEPTAPWSVFVVGFRFGSVALALGVFAGSVSVVFCFGRLRSVSGGLAFGVFAASVLVVW